MEKMKAAIFKGNGILKVEEVPVPKIERDDQILIKVRAASICGSDLHALHVPPGQVYDNDIVMGHEYFGEIIEKGAGVTNFEIGENIAVNPCMPCGECWECKHNMRNLCVKPRHYGQTCDGGFAQYAIVESSQVYHLSSDINPDIAAQTEPLACVMYSLGMVKPSPADYVLLYGAGPIGLTYIKALQAYGVKHYAVVAKGAERIQEAKNCGAPFVIDSQNESVAVRLQEEWGQLADIVLDAVGRGPVLSEAVKLVNSRGRIMLFGLNHNAVSEIPPAAYTQKELTMMGSLGKDFPASISLIESGIDLTSFVTHRIGLDEINEAVELLNNKKACRVIVYPNGKE